MALFRSYYAEVEVLELPSVIIVNESDPVIVHLGSYRSWADQSGVPFDATLDRARALVRRIINRNGEFRITCRGGILLCSKPL